MDATIVLGHVTGDNNYTKECEDKEFLKWANPGLFLFIFVRFTVPIQMTIVQFEQYKLKKHRWCDWDSNPGQQNGRRRQIH